MTDLREAFLADILGHPDDDTPRLVFADWLEDHGDPGRAEFIRRHVADGHEHTLGKGVAGPLLPYAPRGDDGLSWLESRTYRRGFVSRVRCTLADWCGSVQYLSPVNPGEAPPEIHYRAHGPALVRRHPLERVELSDREPLRVYRPIMTSSGTVVRDIVCHWAHAGWADWQPAAIPPELFCLLQGIPDGHRMQYLSSEGATADLSCALLLWARRVADPPL